MTEYERALFVDARPSTEEIAHADLVVVGNVVLKHRYGAAGQTLTDEGLERVKRGDYTPLRRTI